MRPLPIVKLMNSTTEEKPPALPENLTIIGTVHVTEESKEKIEEEIQRVNPDIVAVELDMDRFSNLMDKLEEETEIDDASIVDVFRNNISLSTFFLFKTMEIFQLRIAKKMGVSPDERDIMYAVTKAKEDGRDVALIDRNIKTTLQRYSSRVSIMETLVFLLSLILAFTPLINAEDEIERLENNEKSVSSMMEKMKKGAPVFYEVFIDERDEYMATNLEQLSRLYPEKTILAVVGKGHLEGIKQYLTEQNKQIEAVSEEEQGGVEETTFPIVKFSGNTKETQE
jgi:pheromone shutdown-related protein TraB